MEIKEFRIMIAGSRTYNNYEELETTINGVMTTLNTVSYIKGFKLELIIVSGKAKGADTLGERYAKENGFRVEEYPAKWNDLDTQPCKIKYNSYGAYNCLAGLNRNKDMVKVSNLVFMFHDGKSTGTKDDLKLVKQYNKHYVYVNYNDYDKNEGNLEINIDVYG